MKFQVGRTMAKTDRDLTRKASLQSKLKIFWKKKIKKLMEPFMYLINFNKKGVGKLSQKSRVRLPAWLFFHSVGKKSFYLWCTYSRIFLHFFGSKCRKIKKYTRVYLFIFSCLIFLKNFFFSKKNFKLIRKQPSIRWM